MDSIFGTYCRILYLTLALTASGVAALAQDPFLTIRRAMPLYFNPAYAGDEYFTRATLNYRNHYPASGNGFATYSASFDTYLANYNSGLGITLMSDQLGSHTYSYSSAGLYYSYRLSLGEKIHIRAGLLANLFYGVNNPSDLLFPDMINYDGSVAPNSYTYDRQTNFGADFGTGLLFQSPIVEGGLSVSHIGKQSDAVYWLRPLRIYAHAEFSIPILSGDNYTHRQGLAYYFEQSELKPTLYLWHQGNVTMWGAGAMYSFLNFNLGLYSRQNFKLNAFTTSFHLGYVSDLMDVHYIFDLGFTGVNFRGLTTSSHEIGVIFKFDTGRE
jgi:type IX secretion system PorP/SprF family membrane protein